MAKKVSEKKISAESAAKSKQILIRKKFQGVVVGDKNDKTIVVNVDSVKIHPKYKKRFTMSKKYKVHDENNKFKIGDKVIFEECRPLSKDKRWRVVYK